MRLQYQNQSWNSIYEQPSTSGMATILNNEAAGRGKEMMTLQQDSIHVDPLLRSSNFDSADRFERLSETARQQVKLNNSSMFDTDNSR